MSEDRMQSGSTIESLREKQIEVVQKVAADNGVAVSDVIVDIRRIGKDRIIWSARMPSKMERDARAQQIAGANLAAMQAAQRKPWVYASIRSKWRAWLWRPVARVYLSERGARDAGGAVVRVEVRA